jgi:hypothetical protein
MISLALVAVLAVVSAAFVALPFLRDRAQTLQQTVAKSRSGRLELLERRDRALAALKELELELRAGAIGPAEHDALAASLRAEAVAAIAALEGRG